MSTMTTVLIPSSSSPPNLPVSADPPIFDILRFLFQSISTALSILSRLSLSLGIILAAPLGILYQPVLYLLSPILVFFRLVLDTFVLWPYALLAAVFNNLYPFYVFLGVSCICALSIGAGSRALVNMTKRALSSRTRPSGSARRSASAASKPTRRVVIKDKKKYR